MKSDNTTGTELELKPSKWVQNGFSLAHTDAGEAVFVHGALPGERVRVAVDRVRQTHRFARVLEVLSNAEGRAQSDCAAFPECGGCSFRHISYADECRLKQNLLQEFPHLRSLQESGRLPFHPSPADGYRASVRLHQDGARLGFYAPHSRDIVPLPKTGCAQLLPELNEAIAAQPLPTGKNAAGRDGAPPDDVEWLAHAGGVAGPGEFATGALVTVQLPRLEWTFPAGVFFQSNRPLLRAWLEYLRDQIPEGNPETVELFCGTALISGFARERLGDLRGYDSDPKSLAAARQNFKAQGFAGRFARLDLYGRPPSIPDAELLICNPPRAGLKKSTTHSLRRLERLRTILYSSCNPATLNRDLGRLAQMGFSPQAGAVFDFFPRTPHVETVVRLERS